MWHSQADNTNFQHSHLSLWAQTSEGTVGTEFDVTTGDTIHTMGVSFLSWRRSFLVLHSITSDQRDGACLVFGTWWRHEEQEHGAWCPGRATVVVSVPKTSVPRKNVCLCEDGPGKLPSSPVMNVRHHALFPLGIHSNTSQGMLRSLDNLQAPWVLWALFPCIHICDEAHVLIGHNLRFTTIANNKIWQFQQHTMCLKIPVSLWDLIIKIRINPPREVTTKWPMHTTEISWAKMWFKPLRA